MTEKSIVPADVREIDVATLGQILYTSRYFSDVASAAQAVVKILAGREMGIGPIASLTSIYIVKGRPAMSANLIATMIRRSRMYDYRVKELAEDICRISFYRKSTDGPEFLGESVFTKDDARRAGTQNLDRFPRNMLFARALTNGARWFCPDVFAGGVYTPDELGYDQNGPQDVPPMEEDIAQDVPPMEEDIPQDAPRTTTGSPNVPYTTTGTTPAPAVNGQKKGKARTATLNCDINHYASEAVALIKDHPRYAAKDNPAQPDNWHICAAARACGFDHITDDNLGDVFAAIRDRAQNAESKGA